MKLMRAATLSVADIERSVALYTEWLDYQVEERGPLDEDVAASWGCPRSAGRESVVLRPASGHDIFLRFVENEPHPDYVPLQTFGWAAIEICVQDVLAANERMLKSPFKIIGPPREIEGLDAIYPMQIQGPDGEIVYLTQIRDDLPAFDLPRAEAPIDRLFILVMACSDMNASLDWLEAFVGFSVGRRRMDIVYTMLAKAFGLPEEDLHTISTMVHDRDVFLELDQLPPQGRKRPGRPGELPQGVALGTFTHPDFSALDKRCSDRWIVNPKKRRSVVYGNKRAGTLRAPDGTLIEVVEM